MSMLLHFAIEHNKFTLANYSRVNEPKPRHIKCRLFMGWIQMQLPCSTVCECLRLNVT